MGHGPRFSNTFKRFIRKYLLNTTRLHDVRQFLRNHSKILTTEPLPKGKAQYS